MMSFGEHAPSLRELIAHIVLRSLDHGATLNRTKLVKLLYLIDVEFAAKGKEPATGLVWRFFHYGPYATELIPTLDAMEGSEVSVRRYHEAILYVGAPGAPDTTWWPDALTRPVNRVVDHWGREDLNVLLDHVYFHTPPMHNAVRGEVLDLATAKGYRPRKALPLDPPEPPADIEERLKEWRSRRTRQFVPSPSLPILDSPSERSAVSGAAGKLTVNTDQPL